MSGVSVPRGLQPWQGAESARKVLAERYQYKEGRKILETPEERFWRTAFAIAEAEREWGADDNGVLNLAHGFYGLMATSTFLPNSPTLMNAGKGNGLQYSACYVLPVGDSMEEIFEAIRNAAIIHKSGGGTGFAFSRLRPKDSIVHSSGGKSSGPVSFMRVFNSATNAVKQGGTRRGANMGILRVDHPDVLEFIDCKLDGGITNFNISVAATEAFMGALQQNDEYELVAPHTKEVVGRLRAQDVFDRIVKAAWQTGDPGMVWIDRINAGQANPTPEINTVEATNPCGEQPLYPNEACNLGSINLAKFARRGHDGGDPIDWEALEQVVRLCVRFLDDVISVNPYPLPEVDAAVKANRRIGLGVMGWADLLFELAISYDSEEAIALGKKLMAFIQRIGHEESAELAKVRGQFPNWEKSIYRNGPQLRNATVTTIAPTGSISIIAGASSGIEPIFALAFEHIVDDGDLHRELVFLNPIFERIAQREGFWREELKAEVARTGSVKGNRRVPEKWQQVFVTAHDIAPDWHVRHQVAFQGHTDNGVSKTINLSHSATPEDVASAYLLAYRLGCYGITVFRDGCKGKQVLNVGVEKRETKEGQARAPRPWVLRGATYREPTPNGTAFITVNETENSDPFEAFVGVGKAGSDVAALSEAIGRLISAIFRMTSHLPPKERVSLVVDQLSGIGGGRQIGFGKERVRSVPDAIAKVLTAHFGLTPIKGASDTGQSNVVPAQPGDLCPDCGHGTLVYEEGCNKCYNCGHSEC
ncbi:vitamin B12-dependent ribonucleotide reductase [Candidatus Azambacteria bacterium]|nr:vitamin B12-dependent ribonucleotide reductase [Candidatus Azambacteria bacterium]